jgi:hypothetical protein
MFKLTITARFALGMGLAGVAPSSAAAVPSPAGVRAAVAPIDLIQQAQVVVRRPGARVVAPRTVVVPRRTVVVPRTVVGPRVVAPRVVGRPVGFVRPYRPIVKRPWFGLAVAGVTLGAIATVATAGVIPRQPAPDLCWYWADPYQESGYWGYC